MKKILALLLSLCLVAGLMAGCGSSSDDSADSSAAVESEEEAAEAEEPAEGAPAEEEPEEEEETPAEEAPEGPVDDGPTVEEELTQAAAAGTVTDYAKKIFGEDASPKAVTYPIDTDETLELMATFPDALFASYPNGLSDLSIYKAAEELTGVHMEYNALSTSASNEQFNVILASGDYPDLIGWGLNYANGDDAAVEEEIYLDLTDYIAEYAPNYYSLLLSPSLFG